MIDVELTVAGCRIYEEEDIYAAVDARTETLQNLRELGPPDLVYLVKQPKANANRQVSWEQTGGEETEGNG